MHEFRSYVEYRDRLAEEQNAMNPGQQIPQNPNDQQAASLARQTQAEVGKAKSLLSSRANPQQIKQQMARVSQLQQSLSQIDQQRTLLQAQKDAEKALNQNNPANQTVGTQQSFINKNPVV